MDNYASMIYHTPPYAHQAEALNTAWMKPGFAFFLEQGTGKTKIIIDEIVNLIERNEINCAIVLAPNNVHINWKYELEKHVPDYQKWGIQVWRTGKNKKDREDETRRIITSGKVLIFLMNIEAVSTPAGREYVQRILRACRKSYLVIDESHKIKTPGAARTKAALEFGRMAKFKRIATGTEAEEGIENLFSQFKFLDPNIIGVRSFTAFRSMFCVMGGYENREIRGYQNQEMLAKRIAPHIYAKRKKDCLDLPDKVYVTHKIAMTIEQFKIYNQLEEELIVELKNGTIVDATMAMTRMMRLQQVLCGHINSSEDAKARTRYSEAIPSHRADYIAEIVEEASSKVIIFCRFTKDVDLTITALAEKGIPAIGVSGLVEGDRRLAEINRWRHDPSIKALAITTATGGVGLTLNEATATIFYSNGWSSTDRIQAEDRNHRIGQENKVTYHDIIVPRTIDHRLFKVLMDKKKSAQSFRTLTDIQRFMTDDIE
jgi:SNF2 family DNA or RNA helicase